MVVRKRLAIAGPSLVFVTTTVREWTPVLADEKCARALLEQLDETVRHYQLSVAAYVVMPSHLHVLLGFRNIDMLSQVMQSFKSLSARRLRPLLPPSMVDRLEPGGKFVFWKPRFDDLIIWSEKQFKVKVDYIHNNPVKAGLVEKPADYFLSSARDWLLGEKGIITIDKSWTWLEER